MASTRPPALTALTARCPSVPREAAQSQRDQALVAQFCRIGISRRQNFFTSEMTTEKWEHKAPALQQPGKQSGTWLQQTMTLQSIRVVLSHWHFSTVSTVSALALLLKTFRPTHRIPASTTWTQVSKSCGFTSTRPAFSNLGALLGKLSTFSQKVQKDWIWKTSKSIEILSVSSSKWGLTITKYSTPIKQQYQKQHSYLSMSIHLNDVSFHMISYVCYSYHRFSSLGFLKVQAGPCAREVAHLEALHSPSHPGSKDTSKITMERWIWMIFPIMKLRKKYLIQDTSDTSVVSFQVLWKIVMSPCHCSNFRCPNVGKRREPTTMGSRAIWTPGNLQDVAIQRHINKYQQRYINYINIHQL